MRLWHNTPSADRTLSGRASGCRICRVLALKGKPSLTAPTPTKSWVSWATYGTGGSPATIRPMCAISSIILSPRSQTRFCARWSELMSIAVRTRIPPLNVLEPLRREVRGAAGDQVLYEVYTMQQLASRSLAQQRFLLLLFGIFAGLALLLACIGIYGVLAYITSRRVPEIGVRMAFGASPRDVMRLVLRQSLLMIFAGVGVGIAGAWAAARLLQHSVDGMRPAEPSTFAIMIPVLVVAALFASFLPARRASRIDPMSALRQE